MPRKVADESKHRLIFVCGLSGAGKSVVLHTLEDLGYYCIDNLPINLLDKLSDQIDQFPKKIAIGISAQNQEDELSTLSDCIATLINRNIISELLFVDADVDVLTKRYSETRRKHPLSTDKVSLNEAIRKEQNLLASLNEIADLTIDTSHSKVHDLRKIIHERISEKSETTLSIQLISFGYKHSVPRDADFVFDVRCLPNPYWEKTLRKYSGKDQPVIKFLEQQPLVDEMLEHLTSFLFNWVPKFEADNRSYLTIAIGCTGGRHRSVYLVNKLANRFTEADRQVIISHRDL